MSKASEIDEELRKAYRIALSGPNAILIRKDLTYQANRNCHVAGDPYTSALNEGKRIMARDFLLLGEANED